MPLKTYLINKIRQKKYLLNGVIRSTHLPHNERLCQAFSQHRLYKAEQLPPKVDLRSDMTPVEQQMQVNSCTANALAGAYEYLTKKANGRNTDVSRLFVYYNARVKDSKSQSVQDIGCTLTGAIEALAESGTCLESTWPYEESRKNSRPDDRAFKQAQSHKIKDAFRVNIDLNEMKSCLAQGFPFAFGIELFRSFDEAGKTSIVPMPDRSDGRRESHGRHAMLAVGYSDQSNAFIVRNSWGNDWGENGYCYIPYDYMTDPKFCFDVWAVRTLENDDFGRENWDYNDVVDYLHPDSDRYSADTDDHEIEVVDESDDENENTWWNNDNNHPDDNDNYSNSYQTYERNEYSYYSENTTTDNNDFGFNNQFPQNTFHNQYNNFGGYSDYN